MVEGVTGVHVWPRQPRALAATLRGLLTDPVRCAGLGIAGRDRAVSRFSWDRIVMDVLRAYEPWVATALPSKHITALPVLRSAQ